MTGDPSQRRPTEAELRLARLRRTQALALALLLLMGALFAAAVLLEPRLPALGWLRAFSEAGLVGACADWFAVYALFRRPFGLKIPHTAIIPQNKTRIGRALGRFLVDNFLSDEVLIARLRALEVAAWGGRWLQAPKNARRIARSLADAVEEVAGALPEGALADLFGAAGLALARTTPLAPILAAGLAAAWRDGRAQPLVEAAARTLRRFLEDHREVILEKVQEQSWSLVPDFVDRAIARRITDGLIKLLEDVQSPAHPWRNELNRAVEGLSERLQTEPELREAAEALKGRLLEDGRLETEARRLWTLMAEQLTAASPRRAAALLRQVERLAIRLGIWLEGDRRVQASLNAGAQALVREALIPRRDRIGAFVADVVEGWDAEDVVSRLELQVGPDLQFIRINGTLFGGLVGLALYALAKLAAP